MITYRFFTLVFLGWATAICGCQTFSPSGGNDLDQSAAFDQSSATKSNLSKGWDRTVRTVSGREQVDRERAIALYREGDTLFREASKLPHDEAKPTFKRAAKLFNRSADAFPGSALEQDALLMLGESYFFADQLPEAEDAYVRLQKSHPRNRHSNLVGARLFSIAQYWVDADVASSGNVVPVNFTDSSRPFFDASGHGIRVFDQMRYDDPTGKMADDATMAAAMTYLREKKYLEADQMLTDLREIYPDSEHLFNAHMLGVRCKMEMYAGASYSGLVLEEADKLIERTRRIFPKEANEDENREYLAKAAAEIEFRQAEKLWHRARYREKQGQFRGASVYMQLLLEKYPETPFAEQAREHMAANANKPAEPPQRLAFLTRIFPAAKPQKPLMSTGGQLLR
jgi:outer membrane protein assembly factor BamD (BamD/ComL family)